MICKNCIHYNICQYHIDEETTMTVNECGHFKHKDQITDLPGYIGQKVWIVDYWDPRGDFKGKVEVEAGRVSMLQQKVDKSWKIRVSIGSSVHDYTLDKFKTDVYTSEEAANIIAENLRKEHGILT